MRMMLFNLLSLLLIVVISLHLYRLDVRRSRKGHDQWRQRPRYNHPRCFRLYLPSCFYHCYCCLTPFIVCVCVHCFIYSLLYHSTDTLYGGFGKDTLKGAQGPGKALDSSWRLKRARVVAECDPTKNPCLPFHWPSTFFESSRHYCVSQKRSFHPELLIILLDSAGTGQMRSSAGRAGTPSTTV